MFSGKFLKDLVERTIATFAQAYVASAAVIGDNILDFDSLKVAAAAAVLSIFKAVAASSVGDPDSAGLV